MRPLIKQIEIFFWHTDCILQLYKYFFIYTRELLGCLFGISLRMAKSLPGQLVFNMFCSSMKLLKVYFNCLGPDNIPGVVKERLEIERNRT